MPHSSSSWLYSVAWLLSAAACIAVASSAVHEHDAAGLRQNAAVTNPLLWEAEPGGDSRHVVPQDNISQTANDLLAWTAQQDVNHAPPPQHACVDCFLVVGVKTRAVRGFKARQSIRATWGSLAASLDVPTRVVFLACEPDPTQERDMNATQHALAIEKRTYGDVLTHELGGCVDGYERLADKVLGFFHWIQSRFPATPFVMVADDDAYVRLDRVTKILSHPSTPRSRYYAGQVLATQRRRPTKPIRDHVSKYYLSVEQYPMSTLLPFAVGAHYLLSIDLATFLAQNRHDLRTIGTLEDVSVGFWLSALLQVQAVDIPEFRCTTLGLCRNTYTSYGELSRASVRQIHENLERGRAFCHGFSFTSWGTPDMHVPEPPKLAPRSDVAYTWLLLISPQTRSLRIDVTVRLLEPLEPFDLPPVTFTPAYEPMEDFCDELDIAAAQFRRHLPIMLCNDLADQLRTFVEGHPLSMTALLTLARSNIPPMTVKLVFVTVWITTRWLRWRAFVECLVAEVFPDVQVYVVDDITTPDPATLQNLDLAVLSADEFVRLERVPSSYRCLLFTEPGQSLQLPDQAKAQGTVAFMPDHSMGAIQSDPEAFSKLYVPLVSLAFSDSSNHSPIELLQASSERSPSFHAIEMITSSYCNAHAMGLLAHFGQIKSGGCRSDPSGDGVSSPETLFAFDTDVDRYTRYRFVLAFDERQELPGFVAGTIAAAFLAGSIPVYYGDEATVSRLFNPRAFVNCSRFASIEACGEYVLKLHRSAELYAEMRSEPPIVDEAVFFELFSWHPDVLRQSRFDRVELPSMVDRFRDKIHSV